MKFDRLVKGVRVAGATLIAIALLALAAQSTRAQSQDTQKPQDRSNSQSAGKSQDAQNSPDTRATDDARNSKDAEAASAEVQQLKERLKLVEQTVQELKAQIASMESRKTPASAPSTNTAATDSHTEALAIPSRTEAPKATGSSAGKADKKQEGKAENTITVYGFAMLDAGYEFGQSDPNWFDVLRPSKLAAFPDQFAPDGKVFYGVRQSRLGVKTSLDTKFGELKTIFEFELFGVGVDAGQTTFRLRHAYGELGHFGAGQTWTAFMDPDMFPNQLEYWGPNGIVWFRNVQFRFMPLKGNNAITIALERPGASGDQGVFANRVELQGIKPKFDLPDLTGNVRFTRDWGHVQISGIVKRIRWVDTTNPPKFDLGGSVIGWGVNVSSNLNLSKNDVARLGVVYGPGIENYMNDAPVDVGVRVPSVINPLKPIVGEALPVLGVVSFLDHNWSKRFSSSFGYSLMNIENSNGQAANEYHRGQYALTNLLFYPVDNVMIGGEFQWGRRANFGDHFSVNDYRIQFAFRYNFSKAFSL